MPTRNVVLSDHQQELVKLKALEQTARQGWVDISERRYAEVGDDQLEDFIGQLGHRAAKLAKSTD